MNMMRKNNNRGGNKHRGGGGGRRYNNSGGGGNRGGQNDGQNIQRQKHHATQMREKYNGMVREAQNNGDRVDMEYYLQHVDHYNRVLADIAVIEAERYAAQREAQIVPGGPNDPNAQHLHAASGDSSDNGGAPSSGNGEGDFNTGNQPRMTRHSRYQQYQQAPAQGAGGAATQATNESGDIPLPGSILPPI